MISRPARSFFRAVLASVMNSLIPRPPASSTAVSGLVFSLAYLRRRSSLEPVTTHAFSDVLAMLGATMLAKQVLPGSARLATQAGFGDSAFDPPSGRAGELHGSAKFRGSRDGENQLDRLGLTPRVQDGPPSSGRRSGGLSRAFHLEPHPDHSGPSLRLPSETGRTGLPAGNRAPRVRAGLYPPLARDFYSEMRRIERWVVFS